LGDRIETEVFIHGAVCFSYSGRCAISDYLTGFRANRGECKHPCRWKYALMEETRPGQFFPVFEDESGLHFLNDKDLALFDYIPAHATAGVAGFKIEGRMKSIHYIATTVSFYRQILDGKQFSVEQGLEWLGRVPNRGYSQGFMKGSIIPEDYSIGQSKSHATSVFVGNALGKTHDGHTVVEVRNKILAGDNLEVLAPDGTLSHLQMPDPLVTRERKQVAFANNSQFLVIPQDLPEYTILRRTKLDDAQGPGTFPNE
jgi:putative protease